MENAEISIHQWKIYDALRQAPAWMTNKDLATVTGVSLRRVSFHTNNLVQLGILEQVEVYPGYRFKVSPHAKNNNASYLVRLEQAGDIFADCAS